MTYFRTSVVSYSVHGVTLFATYMRNGGHSRKNLPEMGELLPNKGET
jgi:hypothetical protein